MEFFRVERVWFIVANNQTDAEYRTSPELYNRKNPDKVIVDKISESQYKDKEIRDA